MGEKPVRKSGRHCIKSPTELNLTGIDLTVDITGLPTDLQQIVTGNGGDMAEKSGPQAAIVLSQIGIQTMSSIE